MEKRARMRAGPRSQRFLGRDDQAASPPLLVFPERKKKISLTSLGSKKKEEPPDSRQFAGWPLPGTAAQLCAYTRERWGDTDGDLWRVDN